MDASIACRLCLKLQDTMSVFLVLNENKSLMELIFQLLQIEINPSIDVDYYLCYECHKTLQNFNEFKIKCNQNDKEFRNRYQFKQEPEWKIEIEDDEIQAEIYSNIQTLQEETVISTEVIGDINLESTSNAEGAKINPFQNVKNPKSNRWSARDRERIPCPICGKLVYRICYKRHIALHDESRQRFQCEICSRSYKEKHNLTKHLNTHTKKVQFPCKEENCGKVFYKASALRNHHKIKHTDIRDHICQICGHGFAIYTGLKDHMRRHSTETNYACTECGKLFKTPKYLRVHMRVHTRHDADLS